MRIVDKNEVMTWFSQRGLFDPTGTPSFPEFINVLDAPIPADSGRKTALSRVLSSFFEADEEAILWINEFGIWPLLAFTLI
jgi:hypothetical protein